MHACIYGGFSFVELYGSVRVNSSWNTVNHEGFKQIHPACACCGAYYDTNEKPPYTYVYIYIYINVCMYLSISLSIYTCVHTYTCTCVHIYICIYFYILVYTLGTDWKIKSGQEIKARNKSWKSCLMFDKSNHACCISLREIVGQLENSRSFLTYELTIGFSHTCAQFLH